MMEISLKFHAILSQTMAARHCPSRPRRLIQQHQQQAGSSAAPAPGWQAPTAAQIVSTAPRSSNLRLKKEFNDLDADRFLNETFEFAARFFEASLQELQARNPGVTGQFRQVDANTFTAAIYQHGKRASECSVHLGGGGFRSTGISYSNDTSARGNSFNEIVSVESDDQAMYLKALGMGSYGGDRQKLTQEGAAELFWGMLIGRLQH